MCAAGVKCLSDDEAKQVGEANMRHSHATKDCVDAINNGAPAQHASIGCDEVLMHPCSWPAYAVVPAHQWCCVNCTECESCSTNNRHLANIGMSGLPLHPLHLFYFLCSVTFTIGTDQLSIIVNCLAWQ